MISVAVTNEIKAKADIVDYIGKTVSLKRVGKAYKGLCPIHNERSPSFYVSADDRSWRCFGCQQGGDIILYVQLTQDLTFPQAVELLAAELNIDLDADRNEAERAHDARKARLYRLNSLAAAWWLEQWYKHPGAMRARVYMVEERHFDAEMLEAETIGYAPDGNGLTRHLQAQGYPLTELVAAGFTTEGGSDFFRDRIMFPIRDTPNRIIAFAGRTMIGHSAKYLNSPQTAVFDKSATLYGLHWARGAMKREMRVIPVEGYCDALMAHQHGYDYVVALCGTALTEKHIGVFKRLGYEIVLAMDSDAAGEAATERELALLTQMEVLNARVLSLPRGEDLDEWLVREPAGLNLALGMTLDGTEWRFRRVVRDLHPTTTEGRVQAQRALIPILQSITDPAMQAIYTQRVADILRVPLAAVRASLQRARPNDRKRVTPQASAPPPAPVTRAHAPTLELTALGAALRVPHAAFAVRTEILPQAFTDGLCGGLWDALRSSDVVWAGAGAFAAQDLYSGTITAALEAADQALPLDPLARIAAVRRWLREVQYEYADRAVREAVVLMSDPDAAPELHATITELLAARAAAARLLR